jgi:hypothetical protein
LQWSLSLKDGTKVSGWLALPSESELLENETRTFMEGGAGFSIAPSASMEVCWPAESDTGDVFVFDRDAVLIEEATVATIFGRMVDRLGLPGWVAKEPALLGRVREELGLA